MKHTSHTLSVLTVASLLITPLHALAAVRDVTLELKPACTNDLNDTETVFGPIPDVEGYVTLGNDTCPSFHVEDPQTLRTNELQIGDTLAIDIVLTNPSNQPIDHIRTWLSYDPDILEGISVVITDAFPSVTPGESDFDTENGYVMIEGSNETAGANTERYIRVATVTFRVIGTSPAGTPITFYDVQTGGHTTVTVMENGDDQEVLGDLPGSLKVLFGANTANSQSSSSSANEEVIPNENFDSLFDEGDQASSSQSSSEQSFSSEVLQPPVESGPTEEDVTPPSNGTPQRTAFSLLQVRNLRLTTDGSTLYIGWDALNHQDLKAYNIYYGTTSGRYIQRKTVSSDMTSLVLRSLPLGETYYVAIRAVSNTDEESAFSQEASVEIGNPNSSTAPLILGSIDYGPNGVNPMQGNLSNTGGVVPGATGLPSTLAWLLGVSAVIGTAIAFRRQSKVHASYQTV